MSLNKITSENQNDISDDFTVDENDDSSICTLIEGDVPIEGDIFRSFSFDDSDELIEVSPNSAASEKATSNSPAPLVFLPSNPALTNDKTTTNSSDEKNILDHRTSKANPNGRTPPVDGEIFDMVRTYKCNFNINGVKPDLTPADINALMDNIVNNKVFRTSSGDIVKKSGAHVTSKNVQKFKITD